MTRCFFLLAVVLSATGSHAQLTALRASQTDNSAALSGFVTNDLFIDFTGTLGVQQIVVELDQGSIFQEDVLSLNTPPSPTFVDLVPELEFDTFLAMGGFTTVTSESFFTLGYAVNLGSESWPNPDDPLRFDQSWVPSTGVLITDQDHYAVGRLTLSDDASGTVRYFGSTFESGLTFNASATITDGQVVGIQPDPPPPGDYNFDLRVDNDDLNLLLGCWGQPSFTTGCSVFQDPLGNNFLNDLLGNWGVGTGPIAINESGDFNADGRVDNGDKGLLRGSWGEATVPPEWTIGFDSPVDYTEANALLANWGFGLGSAIPEPASLVLVALAAAAARRAGGRRSRGAGTPG